MQTPEAVKHALLTATGNKIQRTFKIVDQAHQQHFNHVLTHIKDPNTAIDTALKDIVLPLDATPTQEKSMTSLGVLVNTPKDASYYVYNKGNNAYIVTGTMIYRHKKLDANISCTEYIILPDYAMLATHVESKSEIPKDLVMCVKGGGYFDSLYIAVYKTTLGNVAIYSAPTDIFVVGAPDPTSTPIPLPITTTTQIPLPLTLSRRTRACTCRTFDYCWRS